MIPKGLDFLLLIGDTQVGKHDHPRQLVDGKVFNCHVGKMKNTRNKYPKFTHF